MVNIEQTIERIKRKHGFTSDKKIAELFGLTPNDFSNRKRRGSLLPQIVEYGMNENVDLNWLLAGKKQTEPFESGNALKEATGEIYNTHVLSHNRVEINGNGRPIPAAAAPAEILEAMDMLGTIFRSGNRAIIDLVMGNMAHFANICKKESEE